MEHLTLGLRDGRTPSWRDPDRFADEQSQPGFRGGRLAAQRKELMDSVVARLTATGRQVKVIPYAVAEPGEDPGPDLALCRKYAEEQGWTLAQPHFDETGRAAALEDRPAWRQVRALVSGGFARGVVAVNRATLTMADAPYEELLTWLTVHRSFLALVPPARLPRTS
ncbi:hypothetical protein [Streptomyces sp. NPDC049879]|uniref:hypothetical protein n=1 Tax=Streptomyces sp. NPDC049879 TaxID=3365598 RepID=UPI00379BEC53